MLSSLVFNRVYRLEIQSVMLVFSTLLVNCCPSTYLLSDLPTPSPLRTAQWVGGGGGMLICNVDHILQEFNSLFLNRFRTYKITTPPQTKSPVNTTFRDWCLYSSFIHGFPLTPTILFSQLIRGYLRDDVTVVLLLSVSFMGKITTIATAKILLASAHDYSGCWDGFFSCLTRG